LDDDLFQAEEAALAAASAVQERDDADAAAYRTALGALIGHFRRLVRQTRRLILHSDRQEKDLTALNVRLQELAAELDYKATHDALTGAFNRHAVVERTEKFLRDAALSLIVLDIDHFKRINDEYGHPAGDAVIVELIARIRSCTPPNAEIGRVGGEEFTVVLPDAGLAAAMDIAEKMRAGIADKPFPMLAGKTVTASFGVSNTPQGGNFGDAYSRADVALYDAKRNGRNRVGRPQENVQTN
jgi:diguanylate cyclase (GGDEF)-like protein